MIQYDEKKREFLQQRSFGSLMGAPLDGGREWKGWFPINPCICVKAEGCPCDWLDDIIVWLPVDIKSEKTGKQCQGNELLIYHIGRDTKVLVETQIPMTLGQLEKAKEITENSCGKTRAIFNKSSSTKGKPSVGALLIGAFELGWFVGEKIDEETGASDKISDWLADNFPWPW